MCAYIFAYKYIDSFVDIRRQSDQIDENYKEAECNINAIG